MHAELAFSILTQSREDSKIGLQKFAPSRDSILGCGHADLRISDIEIGWSESTPVAELFGRRGGCVQSDDFLLLEPLSDLDDLSLDLLPESDLLDDSLAFLSAAASLL